MRWWHTHIHLGLQIQDPFLQPNIVVGVEKNIYIYRGWWLQRLYWWPFVMTFCHWYAIAWLKGSWRWRYDGDSSSWRYRYCFDDIQHNGGNLNYVLNDKTLHWLQCLETNQWQQRLGRGVASPAWDIQIRAPLGARAYPGILSKYFLFVNSSLRLSVCPSIHPSVHPSVRPSVRPSVPLQISVGCVYCV